MSDAGSGSRIPRLRRKIRLLFRENSYATVSIREQVVFTGYEDEGGEYKDASKSIEITLKDGSRRELFDVLTNVVNMSIDFLQAAGNLGEMLDKNLPLATSITVTPATDMQPEDYWSVLDRKVF